MFSEKVLENRVWLADCAYFQAAVAKLKAYKGCPRAKVVAKARRQRLEEAQAAASRAVKGVKGKVGIIPVHGPIDQRYSDALMKMGGTATEEISASLDALLNEPTVEAIVLHVDSGGGGSYGVEELSDKIFQARGRKKIYAAVDSMAASAAYWIASAAEVVVATPGGDAGSVGVFYVHVDETKAIEEEGLKLTLVKAGKFKAELAPFQELSAEARDALQEAVDATYSKFVKGVARNRGVTAADVQKNYGQGRLLQTPDARAAGMIDQVMTFEQLLGKLTGGPRSGQEAKRASAEVLRLRHEQEKRYQEAL